MKTNHVSENVDPSTSIIQLTITLELADARKKARIDDS